MGVGVNDLL